jgi:hypothetical protein
MLCCVAGHIPSAAPGMNASSNADEESIDVFLTLIQCTNDNVQNSMCGSAAMVKQAKRSTRTMQDVKKE